MAVPQPRQADDDALIGRAVIGDRGAWRDLVNRHVDDIHRYAWYMLGDRMEAEDVVQDTFLRLHTKLPDWRFGEAPVAAWLRRVAGNLCIDRHRMRRPVGLEDVPDHMAAGPGEGVRDRQMDQHAHVRRALDTLPPRQRAAIVLVHYQGHSHTEAATILDVTVHALESLLGRARRHLRDVLAPDLDDLLGGHS